MILTNKTLEHFLDWKVNNKNLSTIEILDFKHLSNTTQNALMIEFFNSVGIYINTQIMQTPVSHKVYFEYLIRSDRTKVSDFYTTRQEATTEALIKANEIYNERFK